MVGAIGVYAIADRIRRRLVLRGTSGDPSVTNPGRPVLGMMNDSAPRNEDPAQRRAGTSTVTTSRLEIAGNRQKGNTSVTNEEILGGLAEIVNEVAGVETSEITPDKSFVDDLDIDSLSMVEIAVQVEDRFGVKVPDEELANLKTVGDAVDYVAKTT